MKIVMFLVAIFAVQGCVANVQTQTGCEPTIITSNGRSFEVMPSYIEMYGCETFENMDASGLSEFCAMEFPETEGSFAADVLWTDGEPCRTDMEACPFYWQCE